MFVCRFSNSPSGLLSAARGSLALAAARHLGRLRRRGAVLVLRRGIGVLAGAGAAVVPAAAADASQVHGVEWQGARLHRPRLPAHVVSLH